MTGRARTKSLRALHWDEGKHPRDNQGKFSRKGGGRWLAKVAEQVGARFGDTSMGAHPDGPVQGRLQTGKGGLIDIGGMSKAARERFPKATAPKPTTTGGGKVEPSTLKVGDHFVRNGAEHEVIGAPKAGRQAGGTVHRVQVRRVADGKTGAVTLTGPVEKVEAPKGAPGIGERQGRTPGGAESTDDFLSRMSAKRQAAKTTGGVTTSAKVGGDKPGVHAAMKAAGIERPDDNGAKSVISRADDRLRRGEDPSAVAGYLREQARALELAREEVPESDDQRYSELTQSIRSLERTAKAVEGAGPKGRTPGGTVDTPRVTRETGGVTKPTETHDEMIARLQRESAAKTAAARAENLATRDGAPPTDGRPDVSALVKMQGQNRDYDLGSSRGRKAHQAPDIVRAGNGYLDNQPASAEIMNPVDGTGDYRYRIYNDSNGATLEEGAGRDLGDVKAKVDRIWSSQRGGGMARSPGKTVRYEVREALSEKGDARGIHQKESQIWEVDNQGNARLVKTRAGDTGGRSTSLNEVARLNLAEYDRATAAGETPLALPGHLEAGHLERGLAQREVEAAQQARLDAYRGMSRAKLLSRAKAARVDVRRGEDDESIIKRLADADRAASAPLTTGGHAGLDPRVVEQMRKDIRTDTYGKSNNTSTHIDEVLAGRRAAAEVAAGGLPTAAVRAAIKIAPSSVQNAEGQAEVRKLLGLPDLPSSTVTPAALAPGDLKPGDRIVHNGFGFQITSVVGTGDKRTVSGFGPFGADSFEQSGPVIAHRAGASASARGAGGWVDAAGNPVPNPTQAAIDRGIVVRAPQAPAAGTPAARTAAQVADLRARGLHAAAVYLEGGERESAAKAIANDLRSMKGRGRSQDERKALQDLEQELRAGGREDLGLNREAPAGSKLTTTRTGNIKVSEATREARRALSVNATGSRPGRSANYDIEGPTKTQAAKMAQLRQRHLADAEAARQRGDDDTAFNKDEQAFDLETDLRKFGYDVDTGKPTAAQRTAAKVDVAKRRSFADNLRTPEQAQARQEARVAAAGGRSPVAGVAGLVGQRLGPSDTFSQQKDLAGYTVEVTVPSGLGSRKVRGKLVSVERFAGGTQERIYLEGRAKPLPLTSGVEVISAPKVGRTPIVSVNRADVADRLKAAATRAEAEAAIADLKRPDLEKIYEELRRGEPATPFNQGGLQGRTLAEARANLVELAVGRNLDSRAIERAGRSPGTGSTDRQLERARTQLETLKGRLGMATDRRRSGGARIASSTESKLRNQIADKEREISRLQESGSGPKA